MGAKAMTPLQEGFVRAYLSDPRRNGAAAVRKAGYKTKYPDKVASQLLGNARVSKLIRRGTAKIVKRAEQQFEITQDRVVRELAIIGFSDLANYIDINEDTGSIRAKGFGEMPKNSSRALESITENRTVREDAKGEDSIINEKVTFRMHSKIEALKLLGNHLGMFTDLNFKGKLDLNMALSISDLKKSMAAYKKQ